MENISCDGQIPNEYHKIQVKHEFPTPVQRLDKGSLAFYQNFNHNLLKNRTLMNKTEI